MHSAANTAPYMGIISWIILGLIAGFIGSKIVNRTGEGFILDIVLGVVGAVVGGYLFTLFGSHGVTGLNLWSLLVAVIGAIVVLWVYRMFFGAGPVAPPKVATLKVGRALRSTDRSKRPVESRGLTGVVRTAGVEPARL